MSGAVGVRSMDGLGGFNRSEEMMDYQEAQQAGEPAKDGENSAPEFQLRELLKPPRRWAAYPLPLEDGFMAQVVLPLDLSAAEAARIQKFVGALVVQWRT